MAKVIMVQGTMSNAGKSLVVAGLCRIFKQDGYRVAPFKSQNMALNSFITAEGLEMGRAQVMQAEAAGIEPMVCMNPILLKPTSDRGSQVIVNGKILGNMPAKEYFQYKKKLIPDIIEAFQKLEEYADIIVIEGAGSPAEINLKQNDIVNMGVAKMVDAPVLLVGDIDRGGVFAQLLGTLMLLEDEEKDRIKGLIINKFRGDKTILDPGIDMLTERGQKPVVGVLPYMQLSIDDEDSLSERLSSKEQGLINVAVVKLPRISNFTDFSAFERIDGVKLQYVSRPDELGKADMVILPGSKNTIGDLKWLRENGLEAAIKRFALTKPVFGICGGYQMLGRLIADPMQVEEGESIRGMELLPMITILQPEKVTTQVTGHFGAIRGDFSALSDKKVKGYEIHNGISSYCSDEEWQKVSQGEYLMKDILTCANGQEISAMTNSEMQKEDSPCDHNLPENISILRLEKEGESVLEGIQAGNVFGTYLHGIFDEGDIAYILASKLAEKKGVDLKKMDERDLKAYKESQYDLLAKHMREHMDMEAVYAMLSEAHYHKGE